MLARSISSIDSERRLRTLSTADAMVDSAMVIFPSEPPVSVFSAPSSRRASRKIVLASGESLLRDCTAARLMFPDCPDWPCEGFATAPDEFETTAGIDSDRPGAPGSAVLRAGFPWEALVEKSPSRESLSLEFDELLMLP